MGAGPMMNLHSHTTFSDGEFRPQEVIEAAIAGGISHLAITDHYATTKCRSLPLASLVGYVDALNGLKDEYADRIDLMVGVEIDTDPTRCDHGSLPFDALRDLDIVLLEYVNDVNGLTMDGTADLRSRLGDRVGLCHTDFSRVFRDVGPQATSDWMHGNDLFAECNTAHIYRVDGETYYERSEDFFRSFSGRVGVSIGTDSHYSLERVCNVGRAYEFIERLGLRGMCVVEARI